MPRLLARLVVWGLLAAIGSASARATEPEPLHVPPPIDEPAEQAPKITEPPAPSDTDKPEKKRPRKPRKAKKLPDGNDVGLGGPILVGSSVGCLAGAPAFGTAAAGGLLLLLAGPAGAGAGGLGLVLASMGLIGLGPCAVGGTGCGTAAGSVFGERDLMPAAWGLVPGALLAVGSTGTALAGAAVSTNDAKLGNILLVTSVVAGALAGPVAVLGATLTDAVWGGYPGGLPVTKGDPLFPRR